MFVTELKADGYKNLNGVLIKPHPEYNLITGMNAQGKTNLIEAIWLMTGCRSFRGSRERDYIGLDRKLMEISLNFDDGRRNQNIDYRMSRESLKDRKISVNGVPVKGTGSLFDSFKCVVFTPDDTEIIKGSPEKRRTFTDLCVCQLHPGCLDPVRRYELILEHRNALLKSASAGKASKDMIYVWDRQSAAIGTIVSQKRSAYVKMLGEVCARLYEKISSIDDDIRLGYTTCGAHRDDLSVRINGLNIRDFGSQGQKKTAALVMKLGQAEIYYRNRDEAPVILLDDVMGELDGERQKMVFDTVRNMQVFITACNENSVKGLSGGAVFQVEKGIVTEV